MRNTLFILLLGAFISNARAQCDFDPIISPSEPELLCPDEIDTLWTDVYEDYQWYKDGVPIPGETNQYLLINAYDYGATNVSVEATSEGCAEMSPTAFIDGWSFLPVTVASGGDYTFGDGAIFFVCTGDTITFELSLPYTTNIEWTADDMVLLDETNQLIEITSDVPTPIVNYRVCGSPEVCPDYSNCLDFYLPVKFTTCSTTGLDQNLISTIKIYPNPTNDFIRIEKSDFLDNEPYTVFDQLGRKIMTGVLLGEHQSIYTGDLPNGIYLIEIDNNYYRFVKE